MKAVSTLFDQASQSDLYTPWATVSLFGNNLAFGKPVLTSSQLAGWEANKAVNALIEDDEGWSSQNVGSAIPSSSEWLVMDLLWQTEIDRVILFPRIVSGIVYSFPVSFTMQVSPDNATWTIVTTKTDYVKPINQNGETFDFTKIVCRYIKIVITKFAVDTDSNYYARLSEIQIMKQSVLIFDLARGSINHVKNIVDVSFNLDTDGLNEWKTGNARLEIDNSDNQWSPANPQGLLVNQQARGCQVQIQAGYLLPDGISREILSVFTGYLKEPIRHSNVISGTLTLYDFWERLAKVKIDTIKDPSTGTWYASQRVDFLVKKIFSHAGFTRFEYIVDVAATIIPVANFEGMDARTGLISLAEVMNYECGVDTNGKGFFRSRDVGNKEVSLEVKNTKFGNKNLIDVINVNQGWNAVINSFSSKNAADTLLKVEPTAGRPNSYDRYGFLQKEISNVFLKQLSDTNITTVLQQYFDWYSEAKLSFECTTTFLPQVELGDVHKITQQSPAPNLDKQLIWNVGHRWNTEKVWGQRQGYLIYKLSVKVVGISLDLDKFTMKIKYLEV